MQTRVVGPTCVDSLFADTQLAPVDPGEGLAVLDAGMYAATCSSQFNGLPRPATVLVCGGDASVVVEAETIEAVFGNQQVPQRFAQSLVATPVTPVPGLLKV